MNENFQNAGRIFRRISDELPRFNKIISYHKIKSSVS